jgi:hypothetical protein
MRKDRTTERYEVEKIDKQTRKLIAVQIFGSPVKAEVEERARKLNAALTAKEAREVEYRCSEPKKSYRVLPGT